MNYCYMLVGLVFHPMARWGYNLLGFAIGPGTESELHHSQCLSYDSIDTEHSETILQIGGARKERFPMKPHTKEKTNPYFKLI